MEIIRLNRRLKSIGNLSKGNENMDVRINDILTMKKKHPCGSNTWTVLRIGADFKMKCTGCGHEVMTQRSKVEKNIRKIDRPGTSENVV